MKIIYDQTSEIHTYPLSRMVLKQVLSHISDDIKNRISLIRFGCNQRTTQEGRVVLKGSRYEIRINFVTSDNLSIKLSDDREYINKIKQYGGNVDKYQYRIEWTPEDSRKYAIDIFMHEIGHIIYNTDIENRGFHNKSSDHEERWCDDYAAGQTNAIYNSIKSNIAVNGRTHR